MFTIKHLETYTNLGWRLFPCSTKDKSPLTANGFHGATSDIKQLTEWFRQHPGCAWGTPTSAEAGVFEYDRRHDPDGSLWKAHVEGRTMPKTWQSLSGGGSPHFWFRWPKGTRSTERFGSAFGRKAEGGYVIVPPSRCSIDYHSGPYKWTVRPWETPIADAPVWLVELFSKPEMKNLKSDSDRDPWVVREANPDLLTHPGCDKAKGEQRRPTLCKLIGVHLARGDNPATIESLVKVWNSRCNPPLEEVDWRPHLERLCAKEVSKREQAASTPTTEPHLDDLPGRDIPVEVQDTFLPGRVADTEQDEVGGVFVVSSDGLPRLPQAAYYGLLGEMLRAVEPETEADPAAVLLGWLACFGNIVGRGAWVQVGGDTHYPVLYVAVVGRTSDAKGVAWSVVRWPFASADPVWADKCLCHGVSTGQGVIDRVRDEQKTVAIDRKTGCAAEKVVPGADDRRCLLRLDELSICFKMQAGDKSTLGETLLTAWGGTPLETPNVSQGENRRKATGYSISVVGDTQPGTLRKILDGSARLEAVNGWLNRFLWVASRSQRDIPRPKSLIELLSPFAEQLQSVLMFSQTAGQVTWGQDAVPLWDSVYGDLKRSGDTVPHTDRARPQVVRLSLLFALADKSNVIRLPHLKAALTVWDYCRASARIIFGGDGPSPDNPDPLWLEVINFITANPGVPQTDITVKFKHKAKADQLSEVLEGLRTSGTVLFGEEQTGGRWVKRWWPSPSPDEDDTHITPHPTTDTAEGAEGKKVSPVDDGKDTFLPSGHGEQDEKVDTDLLVSSDALIAEKGLPPDPTAGTLHGTGLAINSAPSTVGGITGAGKHERGLLRP